MDYLLGLLSGAGITLLIIGMILRGEDTDYKIELDTKYHNNILLTDIDKEGIDSQYIIPLDSLEEFLSKNEE